MTAHAEPQTWSPRRRSQFVAMCLALFALLVGALLIHLRARRSERNTIEQLPAGERQALYDRTLQTLQSSCGAQPSGLVDFCREQADFIVQFPECDSACAALAERYRSKPTR